eukprot:11347974-Karenia_brevis.AAC.1
MFFAGFQSEWGEKLLAAIVWTYPQFGKYGSHKLPRTSVSLKGWRRRCPPRSRKPVSWMTVAAIACDL